MSRRLPAPYRATLRIVPSSLLQDHRPPTFCTLIIYMEIITPADYESAPKRQRRSLRPCDACRKRKTRCLDKDNADKCAHCQLRGTACTFRQGPLRRSVQHRCPSRNTGRSIVHIAGTRRGASPMPSPVQNDAGASAVTSQHTTMPSIDSMLRNSQQHILTPDLTISETFVACQNSMAPPTLGMAHRRFAELYGLGSDMEPILMVCDLNTLDSRCVDP